MVINIFNNNDYHNLIETIIVLSNSEMRDKIIEGKNTPLEECVSESEVEW